VPVVMPDRPSRLMRSSSEFGTSTAERAGAEFSLAFEDNPVPLLFKWSNVASANRRGPYISKADADSIAEQNGVRLNISSSGVSRTALDIMIGDELDRQRKQSIIDRAPSTAGSWAVGKGAGFAAGFADPIGLAANFIPVVGQGTRIAQMANASRLATRVVGRTAVGAVEGAVGAAMFEPLMLAAKHGAGREHTAADVAADIAGGAAMGGVLHPFVGGVADSYRALTGKSQPWALPGTQPVSPEVQAALDAGRPAEPLAASGTVYGRQTRVKVGSDYVPARWAVVDADEVAPAMDKGEGQYRDRTRAASDAQIQGIARNIDFDELHWSPGLDKGAPTLTRDGTIVGGNGRMAAIRQAYDLPSGQAYSIPLRERLQGEFGINPDAVRGMKKPALVRVFEKDVDTRAAAVASNEGGTLRMSALEQAKVDGERLGRVDLASADDGRLDVPENRGAIRRWVEQFPDAERAALLDAHGSLSPEGVMRLRNAALHNAFGDSPTLARLVDSTDSGLGRVSSALIKVAGKIADVRAAVGRGELHDVDIATDVLQAVERLANLRENGMPVDVYLRQEDLLGSGLTPEATKILAFLGENLDSSRRMAEGILGFYRGVERAGDPSQGDIFGGGGAPDRGALLESSLQAVRDDRSTAEAKLEAVSPQTREAAVSVAASQVMSGKDVDVQPIVDADPAIGTATSDDILSMFSGQDRPEAHRTVDMDASREVAANVARAPKAWDASHAKLEADAAVLELERLAKNQDEAWKYSRAYHGTPAIFPADERGDGPGQAVATIERMARDAFGDASAGLMEAGRVSVVAHVSDLPGGPHPADVRAMTAPDGRVYMVAENLGSEDVRGLLLHEVGAHVGLPQMLGPEGMDSVLRDVDALLASGDAIALAARKAVPLDTPAHLVREETLAYLVQNHPKIDVVRRLLAAVRAWLYEKFPALRDSMRLRPADLVSLATAAIRRTSGDVEAGSVRYSRGGATIDPKSELQPYEDAVEKAGKYAAAVRAAAQRWGDDVAMRAAVEQASGGVLVGREIEDLISTLKARHGEIVRGLRKVSAVAGAEDRATSMQDAAMAAAELIAENEERAALVEKRNAALALQAKTRGISYVLSQFPGREAEGMKALIAGSQLLRAGARTSVALESQQLHGKWLGGLEGDLRKAGLWQFFVEDAYQDDVARALWQHSLEEPDMAGIHPDAVRIADIVNRYQQDAKLTQNRYGAWIGNLRGWMYRQAHDMDKLRSAGIAKWSDFVDARLDWDRITEQLGVEDPAKFDRAEFLRAAFHDLSNGDHFKPASLFEIRPSVGPGNMAKKVSQSRTLHWKDANSATAYLREFGPANGSLAETVLNDFRGSARAAGLMKVLGPNYEGNLQAILDHVGETLKGTPAGDKWRSQASEVMDLLHHVDGSISIPHNWLGAKIGAGMRNWQSMSKLGAAVVSQVSDIPVYAAAISHRFDVSIFDGLRDAVSGMLQGRPADERREILADCGHFFESVISQSAARFDPADVPGKMARHMERFFKWGGITWWAETLRSSAVLTMARRLGDYHGRAFGALPAATRDMLSLYRIDEARWGLLRMAATREVDGKVYLTPEGLRAIPEAALADHLQAIGRDASPAAVSNLRADLTDAYRSLLLDQSQYAALEPDARTRAFLLRGSRPGTIGGEILRAFAQFKSFPVVYAQRVLGREVYGRGYDSVGAWVKSRDSKAYMAMFNLIWTLTAAGYVSASVKDLLKMRTPRPLDDSRTWMAAFMQGGALGIYGDYLFGSSNRLGGGIMGSIAGPVPGSISQGYELYQKARDVSIEAAMGEDPQPADVAASALNFTLQNTPYLNLHLLRPALNAALIWSLQERLNPGYLQRSKRNLKRNQGSSYLIDPQAVAW